MKIKTSSIIFIAATVIFFFLAGKYGFTIVSIDAAAETVQKETFDPVAYVEGMWDSEILPAFKDNTVDLTKILSEIQPNADGTVAKDGLVTIAEKHGLITVGEAHVYLVRGQGTIVSVDTESSLGTAEILLEGYTGPIKTLLYIGSRIPSDETSVRDGVGFITFGDFKEQTEYGKVASEINKFILATTLAEIDPENLVGKSITFQGAFTIRTFNLVQIDVNEIRVVPVEIELGE
jgi:predicted lipoprotein